MSKTTIPARPIENHIREARRARNLTIEQLADTLGVGIESVARWEKGQSHVADFYKIALAEYFGTTITTLFEWAGTPVRWCEGQIPAGDEGYERCPRRAKGRVMTPTGLAWLCNLHAAELAGAPESNDWTEAQLAEAWAP